MTPSPRFAHPTNTTARPSHSTNIVPDSLSNAQILPATPFDATIQQLSFNARVPVAGMQSSNYASDAMRTALHLPNSRVIDVDTLDEIEFDDIAVRESDIPPNPDDDDELPSLHHPLQTFHNRPPSPPQFRDLNLVSLQGGRVDVVDGPSGLMGLLPDDVVRGYEVPFRGERGGFGRRIPLRSEGLSIPNRNGQTSRQQ